MKKFMNKHIFIRILLLSLFLETLHNTSYTGAMINAKSTSHAYVHLQNHRHAISASGKKSSRKIIKDKIIYQKKKNGTLTVWGYKKGLTTARIADSIGGRKVASINWDAFYKCQSLKSVSIPSSVKNIGGNAFYGCKNLKEIKLPATMKTIGRFAFGNCTSLTRILIPKQLKILEQGVFYNCTSLTKIKIPRNLTHITSDAFSDCSSLKKIQVDSHNANYCSKEGILFNKKRTKLLCYPIGKEQSTYTIPGSVKSIGNSAFKHCDKLKNITIPGNVKTINGFAFDCCTSLHNLTMKNGIKTIDGFAFSGCRGLDKVTVPKTVTSIGHTIFSGCKTSLEIHYDGPQKNVKWF